MNIFMKQSMTRRIIVGKHGLQIGTGKVFFLEGGGRRVEIVLVAYTYGLVSYGRRLQINQSITIHNT